MTKFLKSSSVAAMGLCAMMATGTSAQAQDATLTIGGRLMLDYTLADINDPDVNVSASEVRRARLFAKGKYGDAVEYKFEFNHTTGGDIEVTDGFVKFKPEALPFTVKVGHFKTHNSLEEEASSRFISTIERGAFTDAFELNRRLGLSLGRVGENYTFNVGIYADDINASNERNGQAVASRFTYLPYQTDETLVHVGGSWRYRNAADSFDDEDTGDLFRFRQRPFAHTLDSTNTDDVLNSGRIVDTGRFASSDNFFAAEALAIHKNLWVAGEYAVLNANGGNGLEDGDFSGGYIEAGIVIGGKRSYKKSGGTFDRTKVNNPIGEGGLGALSLVARYDTLDIQDGPFLGKLDTVVLGADWWPTKQTRVRLNYFDADATNGSADSANGFVARLGFDF